MVKGTKGWCRIASRRCRPFLYPLSSSEQDVFEGMNAQKCLKFSRKKDWEDATCSVCMEYPHNAVLLLCSSHDKGCRPYMCGTSFRYSNCLDQYDQYKNAYTKLELSHHDQSLLGSFDNLNAGPVEKSEARELACPLCRGQVKGWTVVEPAREHLNAKKRSCTQDNCSFTGTYKELRKHVRSEHPTGRPWVVDPTLEQKWKTLEHKRERDDVMSTIRSSMPGAMVLGDYVIEGSHYSLDTNDEDGFSANIMERNNGWGFDLGIDGHFANVFLLLHTLGSSGRVDWRDLNLTLDGGDVGAHHTTPIGSFDSTDQENDHDDDHGYNSVSLVHRPRHQSRILLGQSQRRRWHREAGEGRR